MEIKKKLKTNNYSIPLDRLIQEINEYLEDVETKPSDLVLALEWTNQHGCPDDPGPEFVLRAKND